MNKKRCNTNKRLHIALIMLLISALVISLSCVKCKAEEQSASTADAKIEDAISDFYGAIPDGIEGVDDISNSLGVKHILSVAISAFTDNSTQLTSLLLTLLGIALMSALCSFLDGELCGYASRAVGAVSAALLFERLVFLVESTVQSLTEVNAFFGAVIPISLAVNSLGASPTTASVQAVGMGITLGTYSVISERVLGAVVGAVFITAALSSINPVFARLARSIKNLFMSISGALTVLMGATFALQSTVAAGTDSVAIRSARYAVSSAIPIVGSAVSGAFGIMAGGVTYARGVVGGGAIAVVLSLVLAPLVTLLAYRLCLRVGVGFCSWCSLDGCEGVFSAFSGALDTLIAVYSLTSVVYIVELVAFLKGGVEIA